MPPFAFEIDESESAMVRPALMKVALLNAACEAMAHMVDIVKREDRVVITFDRDVPQARIVEWLAAKMAMRGVA